MNTRLDMDEFELGLMRIAQDKFSPSQYLFQQGQYLDRKRLSLGSNENKEMEKG